MLSWPKKKLWVLIKLSGPIEKFGAKFILRILTATARMKRARTAKGESLTGGSGDVNPQFLSGTGTQSGADTTTAVQINMPITRVPQGDKVTIVELLKVFVDFPTVLGTAAADATYSITAAFSTISFGTTSPGFNEPNVFAFLQRLKRKAFTAGGTYEVETNDPVVFDSTDGAGHGQLIASDKIFLSISSAGTGAANTVNFKFLYRFKTVSITEYVGIVQSQQ